MRAFHLQLLPGFVLENLQRIWQGLNHGERSKILTELKRHPDFLWLKEVPSQTLQQSLLNLNAAYKNFFEKRAKYPRFKKKNNKQSIRFPQHLKVENGSVYLSKIGWVKVNFHRPIEGKIKSATVTKTKTGKYEISFVCEVKEPTPVFSGSEIGIDVGLKTFAVTSEGEFFEQAKFLMESEKKMAKWQRRLARRQRGSRGYNEAHLKVAKLHEKITNQRKDFQHKLSRYLVENHSAIYLEDLNVKGMVKNRRLAKHISDAAWGQFTRFLAYKGEWYGCWVEKIDRFAPSSKLCSVCGFKNTELTLKDREWVCPNCGTNHDRDLNAARNILEIARAGTSLENAGGVDVRLAICEQPAFEAGCLHL